MLALHAAQMNDAAKIRLRVGIGDAIDPDDVLSERSAQLAG